MFMSGRTLLQIPGPTNVPADVLDAIAQPTMDHRGAAFAAIGRQAIAGLQRAFQTQANVVIYPASGTGAWEAALSNLLSPGDRIVMYETGHFAKLWSEMAKRLQLNADVIESDWRHGMRAEEIAALLEADRSHSVRAVCVVHNETSTGTTSDIPAIRRAIDAVGHPALLVVDTISSAASIDYRHDEWGVDVTVGASQKGFMLPPGLSFNVISARALEASSRSSMPRSYWDWRAMLPAMQTGFFPYTPASNLLVGLCRALDRLLDEEGLDQVFARHTRLAEATRRAVTAWGLEFQCSEASERSNALTAVRLPEGFSADGLRATILADYGVALGNGLGRLSDRVFRIGHLGDFNETMLVGTLGAVELGLRKIGLPAQDGVNAALSFLAANLAPASS
jgi:alanine-glyoxylate transaminase/serine-glyoxylate transaminase/serine-pyruvate transaminase